LVSEIEMWASSDLMTGGCLVDSLYIGGGTPSSVEGQSIQCVLNAVQKNFSILPEAEITIEVNPDSLDKEKIHRYREAGVNRVSVGVQSFHDEELRRVGRTHTSAQSVEAISSLRRAGFENISIDLLAALPGQTASQWRENFRWLERLHPEHVSLYLFDVDEDSRLGRKVMAEQSRGQTKDTERITGSLKTLFSPPAEEEVIQIYELACSELDRLGYEHYEISNFARRVKASTSAGSPWRSHHNAKYWSLQPFLGLGCAAHSFVGSYRWSNKRSTEGYIQALCSGMIPRREIEEISATRMAEDAFIFGLRQISGVNYATLSQRLDQDARRLFRQVIDPLVEEGWLNEKDDSLRLAPKSLLVSNEIFSQIIGAR
jgi:oxygen-independent coproporphyrinogen-3 oxidase